VEPVVSGSSAVYDVCQLVWLELRHVLDVVLWALVVGLAGAAGCWCCGYAARAAWLRTGPPARRSPRPRSGAASSPEDVRAEAEEIVELAFVEDTERGIRELESYLAAVCAGRPDASPSDPGGRKPDAGSATP
jgi:hypothetical protein